MNIKNSLKIMYECQEALEKNLKKRDWFPNGEERMADIQTVRSTIIQLFQLIDTNTLLPEHVYHIHTCYNATIRFILNNRAVLPALTLN